MNTKKILVSLIISIFLFTQVMGAFADTEVSGTTLRLSSVLQMYNLKLYDTYFIDSEAYECYIEKDKNIRLYYDKNKDILVTDADVLKRLEVIHFVSNQNNGFLGFFTESNLKIHIKEVRAEFETMEQKLKKLNDDFNFMRGTPYALSSLGQNVIDAKEVLVKRGNLYNSTAQGILLQVLQSTQEKAINNEKLNQYASQLVKNSIFATLEDCIFNLKEAEDIYSKMPTDDLKKYENAIIIFNKYVFSSITFTYAWNYAEKEMLPQLTEETQGMNKLGWMMNYALVGVLGLDPALVTAGSNNESYPKHEKLIKYLNDNKISDKELDNVFGFAVNSYNDNLTSKEKDVILLLGDIDPYFGEVYTSVVNKKNKLLDEAPVVAYQSVNKVLGGFGIYKQNTWSSESVTNLINLKIINDKAIYPFQDDISREEFCNLIFSIYSYLKSNPPVNYTDSFLDTDNINILKLKSLEIINGTSTNKFSPNETITREQACVAIAKILKLLGYTANLGSLSFKDTPNISSWAKTQVQVVSGLGIIKGSDGYFNPKKSMTFEEALVVCNRIININPQKDYGKIFVSLMGNNIKNSYSELGAPTSDAPQAFGDYHYNYYNGFDIIYYPASGKTCLVNITSNDINVYGINKGMSGQEIQNVLGKPKEIANQDESTGGEWIPASYEYKYSLGERVSLVIQFADKTFSRIQAMTIIYSGKII